MTSYKRLANDPKSREVWETGFGKEWGGLAQGDKKTRAKGTNTLSNTIPDKNKDTYQKENNIILKKQEC